MVKEPDVPETPPPAEPKKESQLMLKRRIRAETKARQRQSDEKARAAQAASAMRHVIESAKFKRNGFIDVVCDGGLRLEIPNDPGSELRRDVAKWEAEGNVIAPFKG